MVRSLKKPIVIAIIGPANSGKTTSISNLLNNYFHLNSSRKDFLLVVPAGPKKTATAVGISSAGDESQQVVAGLKFLEDSDCDVYVCAARVGSRGKSLMLSAVQAFAGRIGAKFVPIPVTTSSIAGNVAGSIWSQIP